MIQLANLLTWIGRSIDRYPIEVGDEDGENWPDQK